MPLYHATTHVFIPGQVVAATADQARIPRGLTALEAGRPDGAPSRLRCVFAADSPAAAATIIDAELPPGTKYRVYEVEMEFPRKGPMRLVREIERRLADSKQVEALVAEYWLPRHNWRLFEYFAPSMPVVAEHLLPSDMAQAVVRLDYGWDTDLSKQLSGEP